MSEKKKTEVEGEEEFTKIIYADGENVRALRGRIIEEDDFFIVVLTGKYKIRLNKDFVYRIEYLREGGE